MTVFEFKLPDIGEGVHEGEIVEWVVREGDVVKEDQKIVEVMTDKATVEITSPRSGRIAQIRRKAGEVAKVGEVILVIEEAGAKASPAAPAPAPAAAPAAAPAKAQEEEKTLFDLPSEIGGRRKRPAPAAAPAPQAPAPAPAATALSKPEHPAGRAIAPPAVRRYAREKGIDLEAVAGSGPAGRIGRPDVDRFLAAGAARPAAAAAMVPGLPAMAPPAAPQVLESDQVVEVKGLRKAIWDNMRRSKSFAAHFTYWDECDVTDLVKLRKDAQKLAEQQGVKLSYLPFLVKAVVSGLKAYPDLNAHVDEQGLKLVRRARYDVGIATATDRGLMVVVVRDADKKSVFQIGKEIETLAEKARAGKASREEVTGSTFTITSLGKDGGLGATPIINHPEVAILGVHKIEARAKVNEEREVVVRDCMNLSGSFDHRVIDGHVGAAFLQHVSRLLSQPNLLLLGTA